MDKIAGDINQQIKQEADDILYTQGLFGMLSKYGKPFVTGSYVLNLMTWRDLDIYLQKENMGEEEFFKLGTELNDRFHPEKMSYRNERIKQTQGLPAGLYWGVYFGNERKGAWKIDIWAVDEKECRQRINFCDDIAARLDPFSQKKILAIKSYCWQDPEYRRSYTSNDIYKAVLDKGVANLEEFKIYLQTKKRE
jgi:hypothetical protein